MNTPLGVVKDDILETAKSSKIDKSTFSIAALSKTLSQDRMGEILLEMNLPIDNDRIREMLHLRSLPEIPGDIYAPGTRKIIRDFGANEGITAVSPTQLLRLEDLFNATHNDGDFTLACFCDSLKKMNLPDPDGKLKAIFKNSKLPPQERDIDIDSAIREVLENESFSLGTLGDVMNDKNAFIVETFCEMLKTMSLPDPDRELDNMFTDVYMRKEEKREMDGIVREYVANHTVSLAELSTRIGEQAFCETVEGLGISHADERFAEISRNARLPQEKRTMDVQAVIQEFVADKQDVQVPLKDVRFPLKDVGIILDQVRVPIRNVLGNWLNENEEHRIILSVHRNDYSKNTFQKIRAAIEYFRQHPEERGKTHFLFFLEPTREDVEGHKRYSAAVTGGSETEIRDGIMVVGEGIEWQDFLGLLRHKNVVAHLGVGMKDGHDLTLREAASARADMVEESIENPDAPVNLDAALAVCASEGTGASAVIGGKISDDAGEAISGDAEEEMSVAPENISYDDSWLDNTRGAFVVPNSENYHQFELNLFQLYERIVQLASTDEGKEELARRYRFMAEESQKYDSNHYKNKILEASDMGRSAA
jgi:hypothetical protein